MNLIKFGFGSIAKMRGDTDTRFNVVVDSLIYGLPIVLMNAVWPCEWQVPLEDSGIGRTIHTATSREIAY